jgi:prepilin-type N-terminal cleavage/methylation domain-containing protein
MKREHGFTLIELMIVVVIIGLLAAMAVPKFSLASWKAKEKEADGFLKHVYTLHDVYRAERGVYAQNLDHLRTVGFEPPARLEYYELPEPGQYRLPVCLAAKGSWTSRQISDEGEITDC